MSKRCGRCGGKHPTLKCKEPWEDCEHCGKAFLFGEAHRCPEKDAFDQWKVNEKIAIVILEDGDFTEVQARAIIEAIKQLKESKC